MTASERTAPTTDEQIEAYTIGAPRVLGSTVLLVDYDPDWPAQFEQERDAIRGALGDRALRVEHVGSTSVPGLAAKPVIDIMLVVPDTTDEPAYVPALERAGYRLQIRDLEWHQHRVFVKRLDDGDDRNVNLHVYRDGCVQGDRDLVFRDWLRSNDADRELYERTKRTLAARVWKYMQNYADAKTEVIEDIRSRAGEPAGRCARC
jgi:GrpB-like predicted nucleotidyltransferase (UPF0157 family)